MVRTSHRPRRPSGPTPGEGTVRSTNIRAHNRAVVLRLVWNEGSISRAEIARRTGLSRSTVSNITDELFATGVLREAGEGQSIGGKPPTLLSCNDDVYGIVGVELGAGHIGVALTNLRGRVVHWQEIEHDVRSDPRGTIEQIKRLVREALEHRSRGMRRAVGLGVAVPTPVDPAEPNAFSLRVLPRWSETRLHDVLSDHFRAPVLFDNDANLGALAEHWWGAGVDGGDLAFIKLGTGVGCGFVIDGSIHRGARFVAGELGHLVIDPNGPACACGRIGCLVNFVGTPAVLARARERSAARPRNVGELVAAAERGDSGAAGVLTEVAGYLAIAVGNLVNLVNPKTIVFGGGLSRAGQQLLAPLSAALLGNANWVADAKTALVTSALGEQGIAVGAATAVLGRALDDPSLFAHKLRL